jgi:hypothetical protein
MSVHPSAPSVHSYLSHRFVRVYKYISFTYAVMSDGHSRESRVIVSSDPRTVQRCDRPICFLRACRTGAVTGISWQIVHRRRMSGTHNGTTLPSASIFTGYRSDWGSTSMRSGRASWG